MSDPVIIPTYQTLLYPWDEAMDTSPPIPVSVEMGGDKWNIDFHDDKGAVSIEVDQGAPRLLIYHPDSDSPLSVRWTPNGFRIEGSDLVEEGFVIDLATHTG